MISREVVSSRSDGGITFGSIVLSGQNDLCGLFQPRCGWLISGCPFRDEGQEVDAAQEWLCRSYGALVCLADELQSCRTAGAGESANDPTGQKKLMMTRIIAMIIPVEMALPIGVLKNQLSPASKLRSVVSFT